MKYAMLLIITSIILNAYSVKTYIPKNAYKYYPMVLDVASRKFKEFPMKAYFGSLIEHESCINLKYRSCWSPTSRFKTKREEGVGLGQLTRTWRRNGTIRFDKLRELRTKHKELKELKWSNIRERPDLQIKAIVLLWKDNYDRLNHNISFVNKMAMSDAAYNGGYGGLRKDIRKCGLLKNCNPKVWFNNVEKTCTKSKKPLYSGRSACDINRHHVDDILRTRLRKYIILEHELFKKDIQ